MFIHFTVLLVILLVSAFYEHSYRANKIRVIADGGLASDYLGSILPWLIVFGYITFLAGMRTSVNDTSVYKDSFNQIDPSWDAVNEVISGNGKDKGFSIAAILFKMYFSEDYHMWFLFVAAVVSILLMNVIRRESVSFFDSCMTLFLTTLYYNYFTMMRQWIAVVIIFWASRFIKKKKIIPYILFCILAAQFHNSAYFMILVYFVVIGKAWGKLQVALLSLFSISMLFLQPILNMVGFFTEDTTYNYVVSTMQTNSGSSLLRIPVAAAPLIIAFIYRKQINPEEKMINLSINMTMLSAMMITLASFTSGLFVGRMSVYFQIYIVILVPYLFNVAINSKSRSLMRAVWHIGYFVYYMIQMTVSGAFYYGSDIIGVFE